MTLVELKNCITNNSVPSEFIILVDKDNKFLSKQYIQAIGKNAPGGIAKIKSIYEPQQSSTLLLTTPIDSINVLYVDTFEERAEDYSLFENTIVVCEQIDKHISKAVEAYTIKLPKFECWQILDYAKTICPFLEEDELMWLIASSDNNIERIVNELSKVTLFETEEQRAVFSSIRFDPQLDLYKIDLFKVVNALVDGDLFTLSNFLKLNNCNTIEPVVLANRALTSLKNIILVSQNNELTATDLGISDKQYNTIRRKYFNIDVYAVKQKIKFLADFDLALKSSRLDISKQDMLNYLVTNLSYKITR